MYRGVTHKNNVLRYCKQKIKDADSNPTLFDKESYKLIWELLILLIRQNGVRIILPILQKSKASCFLNFALLFQTVVGTDIAELLMSNRSSHLNINQPAPSPATSHHSINDVGTQPSLSEEEVTNQFRDYLIYGNSKEALGTLNFTISLTH